MPLPAELSSWDAVETRARLRAGDVSPREVVEHAIARAQQCGALGAIVEPTFDRARTRISTPRHGKRDRNDDVSLAGVPTFVKDLVRVGGVRTTWGSAAAGNYVSSRSDDFARRFEATGVVTLGKSATPELGLTATTEPIGRPPCRNPWDPSRSTGGSSGGSAALVASGVVPLAHASDGGGSIRIPASCCGLVGLKPSRFRLDMEGSNLLPINIATDGVLTRSVRDTIAFHTALQAVRAPKRVAPLADVREAPARKLRIGVYVDAPAGTAVNPEVRAATLDAAKLCRDLGHDVDEIATPFDVTFVDDFLRYWGFVAWLQVRTARLLVHWRFDRARVEPWTRGLMAYFSNDVRLGLESIRRLRRFARHYATVMSRWDVLVSPTVADVAPPLGHLATDLPFETKRVRVRAFAAFTAIHNASGAPAISLPLGRSAAGLPIGVQFAAAHGDDGTLLELARSIEAARPWQPIADRPGFSA